MRVLRVDRGTKFIIENVKTYLESKGIILVVSAPFTPQQNGRIERDNRIIMESARSMLTETNIALFLWAEAVNTAVSLKNLTTLNKTDVALYEEWTGKKPKLTHLRTN